MYLEEEKKENKKEVKMKNTKKNNSKMKNYKLDRKKNYIHTYINVNTLIFYNKNYNNKKSEYV